jgi:hypothetical protein
MLELLFSPKRQQEAKAFFFIFSRRWNMPKNNLLGKSFQNLATITKM